MSAADAVAVATETGTSRQPPSRPYGFARMTAHDVKHRIAQVNIARAKAPLDTPPLAEFVAALEPVNALADSAPGFVWRLQDEGGDATSIRAFPDDLMIVNMSVWKSIEALWEFVYGGRHLEVMRHRREWFSRIEAHQVLWWVPSGGTAHGRGGEGAAEAARRSRADGRGLHLQAPISGPGRLSGERRARTRRLPSGPGRALTRSLRGSGRAGGRTNRAEP